MSDPETTNFYTAVITLSIIVQARVLTMVPSRTRTAGNSDYSFVYNEVMLPLNVLFYFLALQTLEVPNNWYTNNIRAILSARSLDWEHVN